MPLGAFKAALMGTAGASTEGDVVLLSTQTASGASTISFTSGIDSTYGEYIFRFYNINPDTNNARLLFNGSTDGGSNYNVAKTTAMFTASHQEDDDLATLGMQTGGYSVAQSTSAAELIPNMSSDADASAAGEFHLFSPSSTTYVKHIYSRLSPMNRPSSTKHGAADHHTGGYFNTTSAIDAIQFSLSTGNFDGTIKMWGVK